MCKALIGVIVALTALLLFVVDAEEDKISELEFELNKTETELYSVNDSIAKGLCLPKLEM